MRILIADCESRVRFALRALLGCQLGLKVVGEAATPKELLIEVEHTEPDLVLLHWRLQEAVPSLISTLRDVCPDLRVIVLSARPEVRQQALVSGADGFVCKIDSPEKLLTAIQRVGSSPCRDRQLEISPDCSPL